VLLAYFCLRKVDLLQLFYIHTNVSFISDSIIYGALIGTFAMIIIMPFYMKYSAKFRKNMQDILSRDGIKQMLPVSLTDRLLFFFVAVTAGVCEEIVFRGGMLYYFSMLNPN